LSDQTQLSPTRTLAIVNHKGGVGKTTTAVNLGAWLALEGERVVVVDLDPQANATTGLGVDGRRVAGNMYQVMVEDLNVEDAIEATSVRNLFSVPSTIDLAGAEIELVSAFSREMKLKKALEPLAGNFSFVLIDCPPSLGLLTVNALAAAKEVIVPIQCEYYALEGLGQLLKNLNLVQTNLNPQLNLLGIVLTMYDRRTKLSEQVAAEVRGHFPEKVFSTVIPRSIRLSEAPSFGQPVALYDPAGRGSLAYHSLAWEVLNGLGWQPPAGEEPTTEEEGPGEPGEHEQGPDFAHDSGITGSQSPQDALGDGRWAPETSLAAGIELAEHSGSARGGGGMHP
jgi:chromosome partitioning protein